MNVLIAVDSRHGSTAQIANSIALQLVSHGIRSTVLDAGEVSGVAGYDAVIIGSAVYTGHWLKDAKKLVTREKAHLSERPVWLFSSGPIGEPLVPDEPPLEIDGLRDLVGAREHRIFPGRLDKSELGVVEKAVVGALHVPDGDYRDWEDVRAFADSIAEALKPVHSTG